MSSVSAQEMPVEYYKLADSFECSNVSERQRIKREMLNIWLDILRVKKFSGKYKTWSKLLGYQLQESNRFRRSKLPNSLPYDDCTSLWVKNGKPCIWLSQPYGLNEDIASQTAKDIGLLVYFPKYPSWHYPYSTKMILWTNTLIEEI